MKWFNAVFDSYGQDENLHSRDGQPCLARRLAESENYLGNIFGPKYVVRFSDSFEARAYAFMIHSLEKLHKEASV